MLIQKRRFLTEENQIISFKPSLIEGISFVDNRICINLIDGRRVFVIKEVLDEDDTKHLLKG